MTTYKTAGAVVKYALIGFLAAIFSYLIYIVVGTKLGLVHNECVEYLEIIDIVSVDGRNVTVITKDGEIVLKNAAVKQGTEGYCTDWEMIEDWRDGGE